MVVVIDITPIVNRHLFSAHLHALSNFLPWQPYNFSSTQRVIIEPVAFAVTVAILCNSQALFCTSHWAAAHPLRSDLLSRYFPFKISQVYTYRKTRLFFSRRFVIQENRVNHKHIFKSESFWLLMHIFIIDIE